MSNQTEKDLLIYNYIKEVHPEAAESFRKAAKLAVSPTISGQLVFVSGSISIHDNKRPAQQHNGPVKKLKTNDQIAAVLENLAKKKMATKKTDIPVSKVGSQSTDDSSSEEEEKKTPAKPNKPQIGQKVTPAPAAAAKASDPSDSDSDDSDSDEEEAKNDVETPAKPSKPQIGQKVTPAPASVKKPITKESSDSDSDNSDSDEEEVKNDVKTPAKPSKPENSKLTPAPASVKKPIAKESSDSESDDSDSDEEEAKNEVKTPAKPSKPENSKLTPAPVSVKKPIAKESSDSESGDSDSDEEEAKNEVKTPAKKSKHQNLTPVSGKNSESSVAETGVNSPNPKTTTPHKKTEPFRRIKTESPAVYGDFKLKQQGPRDSFTNLTGRAFKKEKTKKKKGFNKNM